MLEVTRGPRWPWITYLNFWDDYSQFFWLLLEKNLQEFLCLNSASSPHLPIPCLLTAKNLMNNFWKGSLKEHFYEIISKSDQWFQRRRILKNFSEVHTVQKASPHGALVFQRITISQTLFEKGHTRNNLVKLFQILTCDFREEDFLRISLCLYSAKCSHSPEPCLFTDQTFMNNFRKGSHKENSCEIISKLDQRFQGRRLFKDFLRISSCLYSARSPHSQEPCL